MMQTLQQQLAARILNEWVRNQQNAWVLEDEVKDFNRKTYDKGIAAKMIQWANELTASAYVLDATQPFDPQTGMANVVYTDGKPEVKGGECTDNTACVALRRYRGLLDFSRDTAARLGFPEPALQIFQPPD